MVKTFQAYLPSCHRTYSCIHCRAHLANHDELISKSFQGSQGRAYLFNSVTTLRSLALTIFMTHKYSLLSNVFVIIVIYARARTEHAFESSQKYKEGKFIIELAHMIKENGWE
ncbi:Protein yippee-like 1 [Trachymyrmex zeteki]|uniref:Protein yippee-like 1 n=1 Tax=Mycetomoellerius zeteki TaxID=64791 RepID=A0A151X5H8_9HYME|nr:Protein yippee-like 1 [Trachymyrmex zeteki]